MTAAPRPSTYDTSVFTPSGALVARPRPLPAPARVLPPSPTFLKVDEIATRMRVSKMTVYRLIHGRLLPAVRVGRTLRVTTVDFEEFLRCSPAVGDE